jgi:hypothetical protein
LAREKILACVRRDDAASRLKILIPTNHPRILPAFPAALARNAEKELERKGVEVRIRKASRRQRAQASHHRTDRGHALLMEETVQVLFDESTLERNGAVKLTKLLNELKIPPTVQAILGTYRSSAAR